jgi:glycosyltransferase involved in cell wall biosynthesis
MNENKIVCHISFNHSPFDDRIYWKELLALKEAGYTTIHISVGDANKDFISAEGVRIIVIKRKMISKALSKYLHLHKALQALFKKKGTIKEIFKVAASINASVYHYHDLQINAIAKDLKKLPQKPKVIYDAHEAYHLLMLEEIPENSLKKFFYKVYVSVIARWEISNAANCDYIIATDEYTLNYFRKKLPAVKGSIIFNYSYFLPHLIDKHGQKEYEFIYTGSFSKGRGIENIIRSIYLLQQNFSGVKVLLIGEFESGFFEEYIINLISELRIKENVIIKSAVPFSEISNFYSRALVGLGIFHNTPKYTSFIPIKLFEYMAFGLPVIFSNHGPSARIIEECDCGVLVDYKNIQDITKAMTTILADNVLYEKLSSNAKRAVETNYNWKKEKEKLLNVYKGLINQS